MIIKFSHNSTLIDNYSNITLIVGERPAKPRKDSTFKAFEKSRSGDFIMSIINNKNNIMLTNAINYYTTNKHYKDYLLKNGIKDLKNLIDTYKPIKIIALGIIAKTMLDTLNIKHESFNHPSYVLRFNKNIDTYRKEIEKVINN
jgi:hypothetical protein